MTYGWALLVIVIVIAVLLYINPFRPPEQCIFDQASFTCQKPILFKPQNSGEGYNISAKISNGLRDTIVITGVLCVQSRNYPAGWPGNSQFRRTLGYQETIDLIDLRDNNNNQWNMKCYQSMDSNGNLEPLNLRQGDTFSGRLYIAYRYANEAEDAPSKIVGANLVTTVQ